MTSEENAAHPNTLAEIEAALGFLNHAASAAAEVGHDLLRAKRHRQINDLLDQREVLLLEAMVDPSPMDRLLARVTLPKAV